MQYTVKKIAKMCGITVRTLHYYDEIGLFGPTKIKSNGYRIYDDRDLAKLQQILFFRELEFPLIKIKEVVESKTGNHQILRGQEKLLIAKKDRLEKLILTIRKTIKSEEGGETMSTDDKFSAFNDPTYIKYKDETEKRWGNTDAYKESMERVGGMSKDEFENVKKEGGEITLEIANLMQKGLKPESKQVQAEIERHYNHLRHFYEPNLEIYKGLGQMYIDDIRFKRFYDKIKPGLAQYMRDGMFYFAKSKLRQV